MTNPLFLITRINSNKRPIKKYLYDTTMNSIVFPAPKSSYSINSIPLIWVPKNLQELDNKLYTFPTLSHDSIPCVWFNKNSPFVMIYSHGNACDIGQMYFELEYYCEKFSVSVIAYEYEGYGVYPGSASADACKRDIKIIYEFLISHLGYDPQNIIVFGRSVGTGPSCHLAGFIEKTSPNSLGALIIQSAYTSIREMAKIHVGNFIGSLAPNLFDNMKNIQIIQCPVMFIHGKLDNIIPYNHSVELHKSTVSPMKFLQTCENADHNVWDLEADICNPILEFLKGYTFKNNANTDNTKYVRILPKIMHKPPEKKADDGFFSIFSVKSEKSEKTEKDKNKEEKDKEKKEKSDKKREGITKSSKENKNKVEKSEKTEKDKNTSPKEKKEKSDNRQEKPDI